MAILENHYAHSSGLLADIQFFESVTQTFARSGSVK